MIMSGYLSLLLLVSIIMTFNNGCHGFQTPNCEKRVVKTKTATQLCVSHTEDDTNISITGGTPPEDNASRCTSTVTGTSKDADEGTSNFNTIHQRRFYLKTIGSLVTSSLPILFNSNILMYPTQQQALAAQTTGEAIRRSAAKLPGYGQADVYYPPSFLGKWKATRVIVSSDDPIMTSYFTLTDSSSSPLTISYDVRFITVDGDEQVVGGVISGDKVIADRQFNEDSYYNALREAIESGSTRGMTGDSLPPLLRAVSWSPSNPNVLTTNYNDGSSKEVKVTKRATELDEVNKIISSSEYRRITTVAPGTLGVPSIAASRILSKWKMNENGVVEGIEIVYTDGSLGDPLMAAGGNKQQQQQFSSKSRLRLER